MVLPCPHGASMNVIAVNLIVTVRPDCSASDWVGRLVSAMDSGHYGVAGGASNEAALV